MPVAVHYTPLYSMHVRRGAHMLGLVEERKREEIINCLGVQFKHARTLAYLQLRNAILDLSEQTQSYRCWMWWRRVSTSPSGGKKQPFAFSEPRVFLKSMTQRSSTMCHGPGAKDNEVFLPFQRPSWSFWHWVLSTAWYSNPENRGRWATGTFLAATSSIVVHLWKTDVNMSLWKILLSETKVYV